MYDAVYELASYMPSSTSLFDVDAYIKHHTLSAQSCIENGLYSSAYSHLHLLYMTYVYVQLLRIAKEKKEEFEYCWIGFPNEEKDFLKAPTSPFSFSNIKEKSVFRFFRLIGFDDATIGHISAPVKVRNDRLHASGGLFCNTEQEFEKEIQEYISKMQRIESLQCLFLEEIYNRQVDSYDTDFEMYEDEINTNLIEQYMLSNFQLLKLASRKTDAMSMYINDNYS